MISELRDKIVRWHTSLGAERRIRKYLASGQKPWSPGYAEYRERFLVNVLRDGNLREIFQKNQPLPPRYGFALDERVIEYPWVLSRLGVAARRLLDAGSTLNFRYLLDLPELQSREIFIFTLAPEGVLQRRNVSYRYGDLRDTGFESVFFDEIICISTLEHIGMDNSFLYQKNAAAEVRPDDYPQALREFSRLLRPGGKVFITVPYGRYENHGWLQQFDEGRIARVIRVFGGSGASVAYYRYGVEGWQVSAAEQCAADAYFDIHHRNGYQPDHVAAARAVACLEMVK